MPDKQPRIALAVHGHFYQPPRENPWTEQVAREPSAAPFHDWNARIAAESYRPNAFARVLDERGRVVAIVNNYEYLSFDAGPTLTAWLEEHAPDAYARLLDADVKGGGGMAQAYFHVILPLANERDVRTMIRWGLTEFEHRFGRPAEGMWLPETAVNDDVLRVLAEEGVGFTVLAPTQAAGPIDTRCAYRWERDGVGVDLVFYDGALSHSLAFELSSLSSEALLDRVDDAAGPEGGLVTIAADGETFGHHHRWGDRLLAYALAVEAPRRGIEVVTVAEELRRTPPSESVEIVESAWSCAHGVGRWKEHCGCSTGGDPTWNQRWRAPLRTALDLVRDAVDEAFERRGAAVLADPWAARDAYVKVLLGAQPVDQFAHGWVTGDRVVAFTLLEAQRHALAMYTSCGWFFNDLAGLETVQVLRYAARAIDCLRELEEPFDLERFLTVLAAAESNVPGEGNGRDVWLRHVEPARVDAERVVAHLALVELLEGAAPASRIGAYDVEVLDHAHADGGALALCSGQVVLTHVRTGCRSEHVYAGLHLGGLEVLGATRPAGHPSVDIDALERLREAFTNDTPVTTLLRQLAEDFGPHEFGLRDGLPDGAEQILSGAASALADRFAGAYERLWSDHRPTLVTLAAAGYELPPELRAPGELAMARRLDAEIAAQGGSLDPAAYRTAVAIARDARASGLRIHSDAARHAIERLLLHAVDQAIGASSEAVATAITALNVADELGLQVNVERPQELVFDALPNRPDLAPLAERLGLAV